MSKAFENEKYITIGEAAKIIGRGSQTIKNWYEWALITEDELHKTLPIVYADLDKKGTRYFRVEDIPKLEAFRDSVKYGMMSELSRTKWGERRGSYQKQK